MLAIIPAIRQGERFAVWDRAERVSLTDGPRRLFARAGASGA